MATGIEHPSVVDLVTLDSTSQEVALIMVAAAPWTDDKVLELQAKTNAYLTYYESGQLWKAYPDLVGKRVRIQLDTSYPLSELANQFANVATEEWLKPLGLRFAILEV